MMHCKQMKPISSANNTQQKGQQIERILYKMDNKKNNTQQRATNRNKTQQRATKKTTLNRKDNNMTSKFHKVVHGFAFDKGVVNESKKQVAITFHCNLIEFSRPF